MGYALLLLQWLLLTIFPYSAPDCPTALEVHSIINRGECGVCGDPYHLKQPRANEAGGKYGLGIIARNYTMGQIIKVTIDLTANHLGYFKFRICPNNDTKKIVDQDCLNKYPLQLADRSGTKFHVESWHLGWIDIYLQLPTKLTCSQCVLQWEYRGELLVVNDSKEPNPKLLIRQSRWPESSYENPNENPMGGAANYGNRPFHPFQPEYSFSDSLNRLTYLGSN
ncbi:chitin-binding type-4 domain-containing protein [Nephila pilipes]|uniref:Chitin-binding type-4 domain-containing protein n=1 Tax=Nephila pilipes TaxID=299642 RepID=A0A8X6NGE8_NEPPI|nr:chitin-binding type-4 domain-containing protein [Nephila pilipes]